MASKMSPSTKKHKYLVGAIILFCVVMCHAFGKNCLRRIRHAYD